MPTKKAKGHKLAGKKLSGVKPLSTYTQQVRNSGGGNGNVNAAWNTSSAKG